MQDMNGEWLETNPRIEDPRKFDDYILQPMFLFLYANIFKVWNTGVCGV